MLVEMLGREAAVSLAIEPLDRFGRRIRDRPARAAPKPPVKQPILAILLKPASPAPERSFTHPQKLSRFHLA
jgi:hypothetical protein